MHPSRRDFFRATGLGGAALLGSAALGACADDAADAGPWWLRGNYAPIDDELDHFDLPVDGELPAALRGLYLRNGPNPPSGRSLSWIFGDGMAHGLWLEDGRAVAYRNRWVATRYLADNGSYDDTADLTANLSNTAYVHHAGKLLSLYEGGRPYQLDPATLGTVGDSDYSFDGKLLSPMTAHPKIDPTSGELCFIGYGPFEPYVHYHVVDAGGALVRTEPIDLPNPPMMHDFQLTERYVVFMDLPVLFDLDQAAAGGFPFAWRPEVGARLGVMPRAGGAGDITWVDIEPCYIFHTLNAFDDGDRLTLLASRHDHMWKDGPDDQTSMPHLRRYEVDLAGGSVTETQLDDLRYEFPIVDPRRAGRASEVGFGLRFAANPDPTVLAPPAGVIRYDTERGTSSRYEYGDRYQPDEHVFVPDPEADGEGDGFLLGYVYDRADDASFLSVVDARDVAAGPIARVTLPRRVPFGFHGAWVAGASSSTSA